MITANRTSYPPGGRMALECRARRTALSSENRQICRKEEGWHEGPNSCCFIGGANRGNHAHTCTHTHTSARYTHAHAGNCHGDRTQTSKSRVIIRAWTQQGRSVVYFIDVCFSSILYFINFWCCFFFAFLTHDAKFSNALPPSRSAIWISNRPASGTCPPPSG